MFTVTITETKPQQSIAEAVDRKPETIEVMRCQVATLDLPAVFEAIHKKPRAVRKDAGKKRGADMFNDPTGRNP